MDQRRDSLIRTGAYIDGQWAGEATLPVYDKATGEVIAHVADIGVAETRQAIAAAKRAMPAWAAKTAKERSVILRRWYELILDHKDELAEILTREQGKPLAEAVGEITYGAGFVEFFAEQAKRVHGETIPSPKTSSRLLVIKQPIGVVGAITPWNFPNAMITRKVTPALAVGCTVVVKPSELTPLSALALAELGDRAGLPRGVLNILVSKDASSVGQELCTNSDVRMITFTGSTRVGKILLQQSAATVKRCAMELGGNAPMIIFDDANVDAAVEGTLASKYRNAGQTCVCANRIFVQKGIYHTFVDRLTERVSELKLGNGLDEGVTVGPLINEAAVQKVDEHVKDAVEGGATIVLGGSRPGCAGNFYAPTILTGVTPAMRVASEETFGPVAPIIAFDAEDEVITLANQTQYGLAAYFYTNDLGRAWRVGEALEYGIVGINEGIVSTEMAPFGGVKESGLGREGSHHGIEEFLEMKYIAMGGLS